MVWLSRSPQKLNAFVWRALLDRLATLSNLKKRNILFQDESVKYRLCESNEEESAAHLFVQCCVAKAVWIKIQNWLDICAHWSEDLAKDILMFANTVTAKSKESWLLVWHGTLWFLWKARNSLIFFQKKTECCRNFRLDQMEYLELALIRKSKRVSD